MTKNTLSMRGAFSIAMLIQISNSIILGYPESGGTDTWISLLLSTVFAAPLMLMYARLVHLMPGKDFFGMMKFAFGKVANCVIAVFYGFYFLTLAAIVRGNYAEFIHLTSLYNTSFILICLAFFVVCSYMAVKGIRILGMWCFIMLMLSIGSMAVLLLVSLPDMDMRNLLPVSENSTGSIVLTALRFIPLPFGEVVLVLSLAGNLDKRVNPYKLFVFSNLASILFFIFLFLQNCSILSLETLMGMYFPSYKAASVVHIGSIGTRIESVVAFVFILAGISKVTLALVAGTKAVQNVFFLPSYEQLLVPVSFFSVALSVIAFENIMELFDFVTYYLFYATPFQILIPLAMWITIEIKVRVKKIPVKAAWKEADPTPSALEPVGETQA